MSVKHTVSSGQAAPRESKTHPGSCPHLSGFDPLVPSQRSDPYPWLEKARAHCPIFWMEDYGLWCVANYELAMQIFKDTITFSNQSAQKPTTPMPPIIAETLGDQPLCTRGNLNFTDPPDHLRLKRVLSPALNKAIEGIEPRIWEIAHSLIDGFMGRDEVDIIGEFTWRLPVTVMARLLGVDQSEGDRFRTWAEAHFELSGGAALSSDRAEHCWRCAVELDRFMQAHVAQKRREPGTDFLSRLIELQAGGADISDEEIVTTGLSMVRAGTDTSSQTLGQLILLLLDHPGQLADLRANSELVENAVEEALRLRGPVRGIIRTTTREVTLGDVPLPKGARIYLHLGSASRDEAVFENADTFNIRRDDARKHLGFGAMTRFCLGASLARPTLRIGITSLLNRAPEFRRSPRQEELAYSASIIVPSLKSLLIEFPQGIQPATAKCG